MYSKLFLPFILFVVTFSAGAENLDINFRQVSPPGGYDIRSVHSIKQDQFGYMWMGTFDGIIRYDSKRTKRFFFDPQSETGLPSNRITSLAIDTLNNILATTNKGLCIFNRQIQDFQLINYTYEDGTPSNTNLNTICINRDGKVWVIDKNYVGYLNATMDTLTRIATKEISNPNLLFCDDSGHVWVGNTNGDIFKISINNESIEFKIDSRGSMARAILVNNNELLVGYDRHGLWSYDKTGQIIKQFKYSSRSGLDMSNISVRNIWRDSQQRLWVATYNGLLLITEAQIVQFDADEQEGISHNSIYEIFEDRQGGLWFGTWAGGVSYLHHSDNSFRNYRYSKLPYSLSNNMVSSFAKTQENKIYVGTEGGGLNLFDAKTQNFTQIKFSNYEKELNIKTLLTDKNNGLWVGTAFNGLWYKPANKTEFTQFSIGQEDGKHISSLGVFALCESDSGIWIGTNTNKDGINFYNFETEKISFYGNEPPFYYIKEQAIRSIHIDSHDNLWLGTLTALNKIHLPSQKLTSFSPTAEKPHQVNSSSFYYINEIYKNEVWIGTSKDDIYIYDIEKDSIIFFNADGYLDNLDVYAIIKDSDNNLWITSNDGLYRYNNKEKSTRRFTFSDGIQGNIFNPNSAYIDASNQILYIGGTNGFTQINTSNIKENTRPPNIILTDIKVDNRMIFPYQESTFQYEQVILAPNENTIEFRFSCDNFLIPEKNNYQYRISNYLENWMDASNDGIITLIHIPAGEYELQIKASNNDGIWNEQYAVLPIKIKQYWYRTSLAISIYLILALLIVFFITRFYLERFLLKKEILVEKMERENEEELNEMKLRFFTNISHEFRTPLTLINWPVKNLLSSPNLTSPEKKQIESINRNTNRLLRLINQIIDIRKFDTNQVKLSITPIDINKFIQERILNYEEEAKAHQIEFTMTTQTDSTIIDADEDKLDKIIFNLLSNAFKFTPKNGGQITVGIQNKEHSNNKYYENQLSFGKLETDNFIEIFIENNGDGIDSESLPTIFERFQQGKQKNNSIIGSGIGLNLCKEFTLMHGGIIIVKSSPGIGTRFSVKLPIKQKARQIFFESQYEVKNINSWTSKPLASTKNTDLSIANPKKVKKSTILVVEDNEEMRNSIVKFLQQYYVVLLAANGEDALKVVNTSEIELIVSDVMMPKMDGFELCQKVKSDIATSHIPIILLTALSSNENITTGLETGADAYIAKPFDEELLVIQIKNLIEQRKRIQSNFKDKYMSQKPIDLGSLNNYFLNKVDQVIDENIEDENFSVEKLAQEIGLSRSQLHRKLKQISNISSSEYILMARIKKATTLLSTKQYNVDEVAFKTGFNSHSYFTKCFKRIHGQAPRDYLKQISQ